MQRLQAFHMRCQRCILSVKWYDQVMNTEVGNLTGLESMSTIVAARRSFLFSHVVRLATDTPANRALSLAFSIDAAIAGLPYAMSKMHS